MASIVLVEGLPQSSKQQIVFIAYLLQEIKVDIWLEDATLN